MMTIRAIALFFLTIGLSACAGMFENDDIPISEVPAAAIEAAEGAVDGIVLKSAESKEKDGQTIYEIDGKVGDVKHEVKVTAAGKVLKVKIET